MDIIFSDNYVMLAFIQTNKELRSFIDSLDVTWSYSITLPSKMGFYVTVVKN